MRVLFYSPDSYGLGHVRRSTSLARAILKRSPGSSALLLTGAPRAHYFDYPAGCDYVKMPSITKDKDGQYVARDLGLTIDEAILMRAQMIRLASDSFPADVLLVDHSPRGLKGEVLPTLRDLERRPRRTVRILGMRDVIDEPEAVKAAWSRDGTIDVLRDCYDRILVYGMREIFDPVKAYGIPDDVAEKIRFVGYIPRISRRAHPGELRSRYASRTGRLVVVALGGGGDGNVLLRTFLEGFRELGRVPPFDVVAVTGPLMSPRKRARFKWRAEKLSGLTLLEYTDKMPDLFEAADVTVSMGGYNTVCELACAGARALIVPRSFPRKEQLLRARMLSRRGVVDYLEEARTSPRKLIERVLQGLEAPRPARRWGLDFGGLERTAGAVAAEVRAPMPTVKVRKSIAKEEAR